MLALMSGTGETMTIHRIGRQRPSDYNTEWSVRGECIELEASVEMTVDQWRDQSEDFLEREILIAVHNN